MWAILLSGACSGAFGAGTGARTGPETPDIETLQQNRARREEKEATQLKGMKAVGREFQKFGEELVVRVDRILKKKAFSLFGDPWAVQGLPLVFPSSSAGFHLGIISLFTNIRREDPYEMELKLQALASDKGRYKHFVRIDLPHALGGNYQFKSRFSYNREISYPYFGIGNQSPVDRELADQHSVFYQNVTQGPSLGLLGLRRFGAHTRVGPTLGFSWTTVELPAGSLLERDRPQGVAGGKTHYVGLATIYETLDFEPYPTKGFWIELFLNYYSKALGSNYDFVRATYTFRKYWLLHRELVFAHQTLFEALGGNIPYFELNQVGGSDPSIGLGGDTQIRGYDTNRFIDKLRLVVEFELRWDPIRFTLGYQDFSIGFVPFFSMGRVWPEVFPLRFGDWHASTGWGMRIVWNRRFVIRSDFAVAADRTQLFFNIGHTF